MPVIQSAGQLEAIGAPWAPSWTPSRALTLYGDRTSDYGALYATQPNVRTVVDFLARNIASLPVKVFRRVSATERLELGDHPLAELLRRPNPYVTPYWFFHALVSDMGVFDEFYAIKVADRASGRFGLLRVPPEKVTLLGESWLRPDGFRVTGPRGKVELPADRVWFIHGHNPADPRGGLSPLETLRRVLAEEAAAGEYREHFWLNAARIEGVIERPIDAPDWSDAARRRFRDEWQARYAGAEGSGLTPVLEEGMTFKAGSFSAQDAQYLEARKLSREEVAAAFHVPPPMVGILENATFSNIQEQHRMLYQDTLGPWLTMIEQEIELALLPEFGDRDRVYVEYNLSEKLKGSFEEQARSMQTMVGAPVMTRNEGRARLNLAPIDGADQLIVPLNVIEGGQASPTDSAPPPEELLARGAGRHQLGAKADEPTRRHVEHHRRRLERYFTRQRQTLSSALGAAKGRKASWADVWDEPRWNAELAEDLETMARDTATEFGATVADQLAGGEWEPEAMGAFLAENARIAAENINATTRDQLEDADDDRGAAIGAVFGSALAGRVRQIAQSRVTFAANLGRHTAATQAGVGRKRWVVTSSAPRPSHAALAGQTVAMGERFSNGGRWPGDPELPLDERAGCTCQVEFTRPGESHADPTAVAVKALEALAAALDRPLPEPVFNYHAAPVTVENRPPEVHVTTPPVNVEVAPAEVNVAPPNVTIEAPAPAGPRRREVRRDDAGNIIELVDREG